MPYNNTTIATLIGDRKGVTPEQLRIRLGEDGLHLAALMLAAEKPQTHRQLANELHWSLGDVYLAAHKLQTFLRTRFVITVKRGEEKVISILPV